MKVWHGCHQPEIDNFVDFDIFEGETEYHTCLVPTDIHRKHVMLLDGIRLHFIEMKKAKNREGELAELVKLLQETKPQLRESMSELLEKNPVYKEIYGDYLHCIEDEQTRCDALSREKWLRDYNSDIKFNYEKGHSEGLSQGIEQGIEQVAKNLLKQGLPVEQIVKGTGLSKEKIELINTHK